MDTIRMIISITLGLSMLVALIGFVIIAQNQLVIVNNNKCIEIKFSEGENAKFCECMKNSIEWSINKELKDGYVSVFNKFNCNDKGVFLREQIINAPSNCTNDITGISCWRHFNG